MLVQIMSSFTKFIENIFMLDWYLYLHDFFQMVACEFSNLSDLLTFGIFSSHFRIHIILVASLKKYNFRILGINTV